MQRLMQNVRWLTSFVLAMSGLILLVAPAGAKSNGLQGPRPLGVSVGQAQAQGTVTPTITGTPIGTGTPTTIGTPAATSTVSATSTPLATAAAAATATTAATATSIAPATAVPQTPTAIAQPFLPQTGGDDPSVGNGMALVGLALLILGLIVALYRRPSTPIS